MNTHDTSVIRIISGFCWFHYPSFLEFHFPMIQCHACHGQKLADIASYWGMVINPFSYRDMYIYTHIHIYIYTYTYIYIYIYTYIQWQFQDPKMEVLYQIRPYFAGIFPYIGLKHRPYVW